MIRSDFELKNDKYRRARGGIAHFLEISCSQCSTYLMTYQKDGMGNLLRCYLNRIFHPPELERLQYRVSSLQDVPQLKCNGCDTVIGSPMLYNNGRFAFRLRKGLYMKKRLH